MALAGEAVALIDVTRRLVNDLSSLRFSTLTGEHLRAEVALYERALGRAEKFCHNLAKLDLAVRRVRLSERQADMMASVLEAALAALDLSPERDDLAATSWSVSCGQSTQRRDRLLSRAGLVVRHAGWPCGDCGRPQPADVHDIEGRTESPCASSCCHGRLGRVVRANFPHLIDRRGVVTEAAVLDEIRRIEAEWESHNGAHADRRRPLSRAEVPDMADRPHPWCALRPPRRIEHGRSAPLRRRSHGSGGRARRGTEPDPRRAREVPAVEILGDDAR